MISRLSSLLPLICATLLSSCSDNPEREIGKTLYISGGAKLKTLDPAQAADLVSQYMVSAFYDTLLQYDYHARPYKLVPSMLAKMPEPNHDRTQYTLTLRDDLYFQDNPCFAGLDKARRKITSSDVVYSILRIADPRNHSPVYWMFRGKITGLDKFTRLCADSPRNCMKAYDSACPGLEIIDPIRLRVTLAKPDPGFLYALAIPAAAIVSRRAVEFHGDDFHNHPVGSGPFKLSDWIRDYRMVLTRNPEFRHETFPQADNPQDRKSPLPLADKIVCYLVKQPLSAWLMFLQGGLDMSNLDKDNFDAVVGEDLKLVPSLAQRNIRMYRVPEFQVNYIGFNFSDPRLAGNPLLRQAISLAFDVGSREKHFNHQIIPAHSVIPPGVPGHDDNYRNEFGRKDVSRARALMTQAGFPDGIDPVTGKALELSFDLGGTSAQYRQIAELMVEDMKQIGIKINPILNNPPGFFDKLRKGQFQYFRISWVGDYPDDENLLQL